jgi:hypothetical protein
MCWPAGLLLALRKVSTESCWVGESASCVRALACERSDYLFSCKKWPNKFSEAVELLTCVREAPGSNLSRNNYYPDWDLSWFSSISPDIGYVWTVTWSKPHSHPSTFFQSVFSVIQCFSTTDSTVKLTTNETNGISIACRIWGFHNGGYEEYHLLGCDAV